MCEIISPESLKSLHGSILRACRDEVKFSGFLHVRGFISLTVGEKTDGEITLNINDTLNKRPQEMKKNLQELKKVYSGYVTNEDTGRPIRCLSEPVDSSRSNIDGIKRCSSLQNIFPENLDQTETNNSDPSENYEGMQFNLSILDEKDNKTKPDCCAIELDRHEKSRAEKHTEKNVSHERFSYTDMNANDITEISIADDGDTSRPTSMNDTLRSVDGPSANSRRENMKSGSFFVSEGTNSFDKTDSFYSEHNTNSKLDKRESRPILCNEKLNAVSKFNCDTKNFSEISKSIDMSTKRTDNMCCTDDNVDCDHNESDFHQKSRGRKQKYPHKIYSTSDDDDVGQKPSSKAESESFPSKPELNRISNNHKMSASDGNFSMHEAVHVGANTDIESGIIAREIGASFGPKSPANGFGRIFSNEYRNGHTISSPDVELPIKQAGCVDLELNAENNEVGSAYKKLHLIDNSSEKFTAGSKDAIVQMNSDFLLANRLTNGNINYSKTESAQDSSNIFPLEKKLGSCNGTLSPKNPNSDTKNFSGIDKTDIQLKKSLAQDEPKRNFPETNNNKISNLKIEESSLRNGVICYDERLEHYKEKGTVQKKFRIMNEVKDEPIDSTDDNSAALKIDLMEMEIPLNGQSPTPDSRLRYRNFKENKSKSLDKSTDYRNYVEKEISEPNVTESIDGHIGQSLERYEFFDRVPEIQKLTNDHQSYLRTSDQKSPKYSKSPKLSKAVNGYTWKPWEKPSNLETALNLTSACDKLDLGLIEERSGKNFSSPEKFFDFRNSDPISHYLNHFNSLSAIPFFSLSGKLETSTTMSNGVELKQHKDAQNSYFESLFNASNVIQFPKSHGKIISPKLSPASVTPQSANRSTHQDTPTRSPKGSNTNISSYYQSNSQPEIKIRRLSGDRYPNSNSHEAKIKDKPPRGRNENPMEGKFLLDSLTQAPSGRKRRRRGTEEALSSDEVTEYMGEISEISPYSNPSQNTNRSESGRFVCRYCDVVSCGLASYLSHTVTQHRAYICHECGKVFTTKSSLLRHRPIHTGVRRFACAICKRTFYRKDKCKAHIRKHLEDNAISSTTNPMHYDIYPTEENHSPFIHNFDNARVGENNIINIPPQFWLPREYPRQELRFDFLQTPSGTFDDPEFRRTRPTESQFNVATEDRVISRSRETEYFQDEDSNEVLDLTKRTSTIR